MSNNNQVDKFQIEDYSITDIKVDNEAGISQSKIENLISDLDSKVSDSGDIMTGELYLHADPQVPLHAATKQYVDIKSNSVKNLLEATTSIYGLKMEYINAHSINITKGFIRITEEIAIPVSTPHIWTFNEAAGQIAFDSRQEVDLHLAGVYNWGAGHLSLSGKTSKTYWRSAPGVFYDVNDFSVVTWVEWNTLNLGADRGIYGWGKDNENSKNGWKVRTANDTGTGRIGELKLVVSNGNPADTTLPCNCFPQVGKKYLVIITYKRNGGANNNEASINVTEDGVTWFRASSNAAVLMQRQQDYFFTSHFNNQDGTNAKHYRIEYYPEKVLTHAEMQDLWVAGSEAPIPSSAIIESPLSVLYTVPSDIQVDFNSTGIGGLDTGTLEPNKFYYIHMFGNSLNKDVGIMASLSGNLSSLPSGYDQSRVIGAVRTDALGNLKPFKTMGNQSYRELIWDDMLFVSSQYHTTVSLAPHIPLELTKGALVSISYANANGGTADSYIRKGNSGSSSFGSFSFRWSNVRHKGSYNQTAGGLEGEIFTNSIGNIELSYGTYDIYVKGYIWDL